MHECTSIYYLMKDLTRYLQESMFLNYWRKHPVKVLGIDVGKTSIKLVYLIGQSRTHFTVAGHTCIPLQEDIKDSMLALKNALKKGLVQFNLYSIDCAFSISDTKLLKKKIHIDTNHQHWKRTALLTVAPHVPMPIDTLYTDFQIISDTKSTAMQQSVLFIACRRDALDQLIETLESCRLQPIVIEPESFALERAYRHLYCLEQYPTLWALVKVGSSTVTIFLWQKQKLVVTTSYILHATTTQSIVLSIYQHLSVLLLGHTILPLRALFVLGSHLKINIIEMQLKQLFNTLQFKSIPKTNLQLSKPDLSYLCPAFGLALRAVEQRF